MKKNLLKLYLTLDSISTRIDNLLFQLQRK